MQDWWIEYTDGTRRIFQAPDKVAAHHYFMMEGDHAYNYGLVENWGQYFPTEEMPELPPLKHRGGRSHYEIDTDD